MKCSVSNGTFRVAGKGVTRTNWPELEGSFEQNNEAPVLNTKGK